MQDNIDMLTGKLNELIAEKDKKAGESVTATAVQVHLSPCQIVFVPDDFASTITTYIFSTVSHQDEDNAPAPSTPKRDTAKVTRLPFITLHPGLQL